MAGGPIGPSFVYPETSGSVFENVHLGDGANLSPFIGIGVAASLGTDASILLEFKMPPSLPTGTAKFVVEAIADAVTGAILLNPTWASYGAGEDPSSLTLNAEGSVADAVNGAAGTPTGNETIDWGTADDDQVIEAVWTLNADTVVAGETIYMELICDAANTETWTLAVITTLRFWIIWE